MTKTTKTVALLALLIGFSMLFAACEPAGTGGTGTTEPSPTPPTDPGTGTTETPPLTPTDPGTTPTDPGTGTTPATPADPTPSP
ncbi:MAG: hypothetical protein IGS50_18855 [Synechococcales cyanobacterium C42_A2020_086]|nr:hypothetical protein [Synechococcales cyanobacterium C42_A2020_086]